MIQIGIKNDSTEISNKNPSKKKTVATMRAENMQKKAEVNIHFKKCSSKDYCSSCSQDSLKDETKHPEVLNNISKYMSVSLF
jgi:hypothetical protein